MTTVPAVPAVDAAPAAEPAKRDDAGAATGRPPLSGPALVAAFVAVALWALFTAIMIVKAGDKSEVTWTRLAWLFSSVEAVAFGAAGALFGSSVQRERAEKAEKAASENQDAAAKGKALAEVLKAEASVAADSAVAPGATARGSASAADVASGIVSRHGALARSLFP